MKEKISKDLASLLSKNVWDLPLSVRVKTALSQGELFCLYQIVVCSEEDLLNLAGFGKKSLIELKKVLGDLNLSLNMDLDSDIADCAKRMNYPAFLGY